MTEGTSEIDRVRFGTALKPWIGRYVGLGLLSLMVGLAAAPWYAHAELVGAVIGEVFGAYMIAAIVICLARMLKKDGRRPWHACLKAGFWITFVWMLLNILGQNYQRSVK